LRDVKMLDIVIVIGFAVIMAVVGALVFVKRKLF